MPLLNGSTDQLRQYVPVTITYTAEALLPTLEATQARLLDRFFGPAIASQFEELVNTASQALSTVERQALHLARSAVARIAFAEHVPFAEVQIDDIGITVPAMEGRKAAFEYQTNKLTQTLLERGWSELDALITLVASQTEIFPTWPDSPYFQEHQDALFKTPAEFSRYYPIQDRWLTFWALRPFIRAVEEDRGVAAVARIDELAPAVPEATRALIRRKLQRALAYQSVIEALPNLSVEIQGVNLQVNYSSQYGNTQYYNAPGKEQLSWLLDNLTRQADLAWRTYEDSLTAVLAPNAFSDSTGLVYSTGAVTLL
ncbi:DUF6712 family protein [Spirosoma sordidisoli]|uniref:Uncharacterized protein n=1 Tax=Spirosoma sordidisoli TaxID=2502893 RepID=A0A4Q2UKJ2_9BACT|nr:DUF6712 family protein [Spirosoma sordidisoli]RYC69814.1 hypothetical protein EQG79_14570 [Spirosoma sordidisoli]